MKMKRHRLEFLKSLGQPPSQAIWVMVYSDMITGLMVFFLILWASTQIRKTPVESPPPTTPLQLQIKEQLGQVGTVVVTRHKMTVTLPSAVLFDPGRAELKPAARASLERVADALTRSSAPVVVEGHTDDAPIQKSGWRSNYELSAARAFSVIQFFTSTGRLPPTRLAARGYGPYRPVAPNDGEDNRAKNRRIEIHLLVAS